MRSLTLLAAALFAASSQATVYFRRANSSSTTSSSSQWTSIASEQSSTRVDDHESTLLSTYSEPTGISTHLSVSETVTIIPTLDLPPFVLAASTSIPSVAGSTVLASATGNATGSGKCTGCVLEAMHAEITWAPEDEVSSLWTSVVVTETILTKTISYFTGEPETLDGTTVEYETLNQTKTLALANVTITHTAPMFTVTPTEGVELTLPAGPTYAIYRTLYGAPDADITDLFNGTLGDCVADPIALNEFLPIRTEDWSYFIGTLPTHAPTTDIGEPTSLPPNLIDYLKQIPGIQTLFHSNDIATCTLEAPGHGVGSSVTDSTRLGAAPTDDPPPVDTPPPLQSPAAPAPIRSSALSTYLSTTYEATSTHVTVRGCLRCDTETNKINVISEPTPVLNGNSKPTDNPKPDDKPKLTEVQPNVPQSVTIGDHVYTIQPGQPNQQTQSAQPTDSNQPNQPAQPTDSNQPNQQGKSDQQDNPYPGVVIESKTLKPGQTTSINGVAVVVPTAGGGSRLVVGDSTILVEPAPTGPPVLTLGDTTATANSQGHFIVGTHTLTPGGPAVTVDGSTLSLGPSGTVAVVNGATRTLGNAPYTPPPSALIVGSHTVSATVLGGTTAFVIAPDQTLTPGGVITHDGITFSLPKGVSGSTVVINGITSTLNGQSLITATVQDGHVAFVLGQGKTLTPGGVLTVSGTTYSLPSSASGSVVVVNGATSTYNGLGLPVLALSGQSITATVASGTTAFIVGPGQTLTAGGELTISNTVYSMPKSASGSVVVINGVTSTLGQVQGPITQGAALTIDGKTYSATVSDGTTQYVLGEETTIKPGDAITVSGTTYSLDQNGTALVVNGKTSSIPMTPASNSASATATNSASISDSGSSTTGQRHVGNFIASGLGISESSTGGAVPARGALGIDKWVEGIVMGISGWLLMIL